MRGNWKKWELGKFTRNHTVVFLSYVCICIVCNVLSLVYRQDKTIISLFLCLGNFKLAETKTKSSHSRDEERLVLLYIRITVRSVEYILFYTEIKKI